MTKADESITKSITKMKPKWPPNNHLQAAQSHCQKNRPIGSAKALFAINMNLTEKIFNAIIPAYQNALDLFQDADILYKSDRLPRAYCLYHFSFEETGKCFILINLFLDYAMCKIKFQDIKPKLLKERGFQDHIDKLKKSTLEFSKFGAFVSILGGKKDIIQQIEKMYDNFNVEKMDNNKNQSIYLTFKNNNFMMPSDLLNEDDFHEMKNLAEINLNFLKIVIQAFEKEDGYNNIVTKIKKEYCK